MRKWLHDIRGTRTQTEMALLLSITQGYYSGLESGNKTPKPQTAQRLASLLGFDWQRFYEDESESA